MLYLMLQEPANETKQEQSSKSEEPKFLWFLGKSTRWGVDELSNNQMLFNLFLFSCQLMYYGLGKQWEFCIYLGCKFIDETIGSHLKWRNEKPNLFHLFVRVLEQANQKMKQ